MAITMSRGLIGFAPESLLTDQLGLCFLRAVGEKHTGRKYERRGSRQTAAAVYSYIQKEKSGREHKYEDKEEGDGIAKGRSRF